MHGKASHVRPITAQTRQRVSGALAAGWARVSAGRKGEFADNLEICHKTINRTLTGETLPELHTALNSLVDDPTALDEVLALYGMMLVRRRAVHGSESELLSGLGHTLAEAIDRMRDGKLCHIDKLALADLFRPLIPQMAAIVDEADALRGVR